MHGVEHMWATSSKHLTSEGLVRYQRCCCGLRRITLDERVLAEPDRPSSPRGSVGAHPGAVPTVATREPEDAELVFPRTIGYWTRVAG